MGRLPIKCRPVSHLPPPRLFNSNMIKIGSILTPRETENILGQLDSIARRTNDRRIQEKCRMIRLTVKKADRRVPKDTLL